MEPPSRHIHGRIYPVEPADKLTNMSYRIQDTTYFAVFLEDDSRVKSIEPPRVVVGWLSSNVHGRVFSESGCDVTNGDDWKARELSLIVYIFLGFIMFVFIVFLSFSFVFLFMTSYLKILIRI